ncbi:hypothetical protein [Geobacter sp.]|uniref:hypothetical protein n=1 Tax=Geobacter sp. TaxID=46610 RepID=UPI0026209A38|nr:hypothetical protein [Geobacter sp.]
MAKTKIRDWVEPAHPVLVQRFDDLVEIYRFLKNSIQEKADTVFDRVSRQIGFVVTTTLPLNLDIAEGGKIARAELGGKNLQGTLFEKEFAPVLKEITGKSAGKVAAGSYSLFLLWHEALKLKLKADWIEPAHFRNFQTVTVQPAVAEELAQLNPGIREPAHWFDAGIALAKEEEILIAAIDEVYTDLKLAERVAVSRRESLGFVPGVREPAHFREIIEEIVDLRTGRGARLSPGIREPAHFRRLLEREDFAKLIAELAEILKG